MNKILFFSDLFLYYFLVAGDDDVSRKTDDAFKWCVNLRRNKQLEEDGPF
jgi:hypothetical protein